MFACPQPTDRKILSDRNIFFFFQTVFFFKFHKNGEKLTDDAFAQFDKHFKDILYGDSFVKFRLQCRMS